MSATPTTSLHRTPVDRTAINRANSRHSTGPCTDSGKQRSSLNALRHGLTAASAVLPSEDQAAYDAHCRGFFDEYQPATPTETQLTQELVDTSWRLNRVPLLEAALLELHKHKGVPWEPADHGFVFSKDQVEAFSERLIRLNERTARDALAG